MAKIFFFVAEFLKAITTTTLNISIALKLDFISAYFHGPKYKATAQVKY